MKRSSKPPTAQGFTMTELMVVVAVIGILTGTAAIQVSGSEWRRERVNAAALELAGWLESVRRASQRGNACVVTLNNGSTATRTGLAGNAQMARAAEIATPTLGIPNNCSVASPANLPAITGNSPFTMTSTNASFTFTPRGTVSPPPAEDAPIEMTISLEGTGPGRCVRVRNLVGLVEIGRLEQGGCSYGVAF